MAPVRFLTIFPQSEDSLLAEWKSPDTSVIRAYVVEWKPCGMTLDHVSFDIVDRNQTSFLISSTVKIQIIILVFSLNISECLFTINVKMNCIFVSKLGLEPYMPYEISVYPKYECGVGQPSSTVAYTKQKG